LDEEFLGFFRLKEAD